MVEEESESNNYELLYKIIIIGDTCVGKSNILSRYLKDEFREDSKSTVGVELGTKFLKVKDVGTKIQIWDTAGQERYRSITSSYYKGSHGCFIVYDITSEISFENVDKWYQQAQKEASKDVSIILVGNKCDLEDQRKVSKEKGEEKAKQFNIPFFETSALSKIKIDDIFNEMVNNIFERTGGPKNDDDDDIEIINENDKAVSLNSQEQKKKGCC
jgi:small GTP-binding protein